MADKRWGRKEPGGVEDASLEDTQPLMPGRPTRRDVIRYAKGILDATEKGRRRGDTDPNPPSDSL